MTLHLALAKLLQRGWWVILSQKGVLLRRDYTRIGESKTYSSIDELISNELVNESWSPDDYDEPLQRAIDQGWWIACGPDRMATKGNGKVIVSLTNRHEKYKGDSLDSVQVAIDSKCLGIIVRKLLR